MMDSIPILLLRTTCCTVIAGGLSALLLRHQTSPKIQRIAAVLVLLQGWAFLPIVVPLPVAIPTENSIPVEISTRKQLFTSESSTSHIHATNPPRPQERFSAASLATACLTILWSAGIVAIAVRGLARYVSLVCRLPLGLPPTETDWLKDWQHVTDRVSPKANIQFRITESIGPLVCYVPFAYLILTPRKIWATFDFQQRRAVLHHELAHIARRDLWKSLAVHLLAMPQWFNPFAWKSVRAFEEAAEWACDDFVMKTQEDAYHMAYPSALLSLAQSHFPNVPGSVAANDGNLNTRIRRLVQPRFKEESRMTKSLALSLLVSVALLQTVRISSTIAEEPIPTDSSVILQDPAGYRTRTFHIMLAESHRRKLANTGVVPYRVGTPDVLEISLTSRDIPGEMVLNEALVVSPDGSVALGEFGEINVRNLTIDEIKNRVQALLKDKDDNRHVTVEVKTCNSKVLYVVLRGESDRIHRIPCTPNSNLRKTIESLNLKFPLAKTTIWVSRPHSDGQENRGTIHPIEWKKLSSDKNSPNYFPLYPMDRVFVTTEEVQPAVTSDSPVPAPYYAAPKSDVQLDIRIIEDKHNNFSEFEELSNGRAMVANTQATMATMRILSKNNLTRTLAAPTITCHPGQKCALTIGTFQMQAVASITNHAKLRLKTRVSTDVQRAEENHTETTVEMGADEMLMLRTESDPSVYVAVTAQLLRKNRASSAHPTAVP